jgi:sulfur carrier protein ThiS
VIMHFAGSQQDLTGCKFVRSLGENALNNHMVTINGMGLTSERWSAIEVKDGDRIFIFLPVTGG